MASASPTAPHPHRHRRHEPLDSTSVDRPYGLRRRPARQPDRPAARPAQGISRRRHAPEVEQAVHTRPPTRGARAASNRCRCRIARMRFGLLFDRHRRSEFESVRYDGIKYACARGRRAAGHVPAHTRPGVRRRGQAAHHARTYALSAGYYDAYYLKASRSHVDPRDFLGVLEHCHAIVTPTARARRSRSARRPAIRFRCISRTSSPCPSILRPAGLSLPCGFDGARLPIGLQLIGRPSTGHPARHRAWLRASHRVAPRAPPL